MLWTGRGGGLFPRGNCVAQCAGGVRTRAGPPGAPSFDPRQDEWNELTWSAILTSGFLLAALHSEVSALFTCPLTLSNR